MRVLLVSFVADDPWTGMGKWAHAMSEGLRRLGDAVTVWFADDFPAVRQTGRLSVVAFPPMLAARLVAHRSQFDVVVIHEPSGVWYGLLRRLFGALPPMVLMCHNVESQAFRDLRRAARRGLCHLSLGTHIKTPLFRLSQSEAAIRLADHVLCLSSVDQSYLLHRAGRRPERITRLTNGVAEDDLIDRATPSGRRVLFVGGWLDVKGRRLLPSIWAEIRRGSPGATLSLVGTGVPAERVLADFGRDDRASVTVVASRRDDLQMREQFAGHDLLLVPSLSEGCPLSVLEAMAARVPVVAAAVGGIPDLITHERDGLLFEPLDGARAAALVGRLLDDPREAHRIAEAAQDRARGLTWLRSAEDLAEALRITVARVTDERRGKRVVVHG